MLLATGSRGGARPQEVMELLPLGGDIKTYRQDLFQWEGNNLITPAGVGSDYYLGENYFEKNCMDL